MRRAQVIFLVLIVQLGLINSLIAQNWELTKYETKCMAGDCENGEGLLLATYSYVHQSNGNRKLECFLVKGSFKEEQLNGFASVAQLPGYVGSNFKKLLKKEKDHYLKLANIKSFIGVESALNLSTSVFEGHFKNNLPIGTIKYYQCDASRDWYDPSYQRNLEFEYYTVYYEKTISKWVQENERMLYVNNIKSNNIKQRIFYGTVNENYAREKKMKFYYTPFQDFNVDSVIVDNDVGRYKVINNYENHNTKFNITYRELKIGNRIETRIEKELKTEDDRFSAIRWNTFYDIVTITENGKTIKFKQPVDNERVLSSGTSLALIAKKKAQNYKEKKDSEIWCSCYNCSGIGTIKKPYHIKDVESYYQQGMKTGNVYRIVNVKEKTGISNIKCETCMGTGKIICN